MWKAVVLPLSVHGAALTTTAEQIARFPLSSWVNFVSWQPGELGLVVLWRGGEHWYTAGPQSSSGGGSQGSYHLSNQFVRSKSR